MFSPIFSPLPIISSPQQNDGFRKQGTLERTVGNGLKMSAEGC